jgi:hypothetical protein
MDLASIDELSIQLQTIGISLWDGVSFLLLRPGDFR